MNNFLFLLFFLRTISVKFVPGWNISRAEINHTAEMQRKLVEISL